MSVTVKQSLVRDSVGTLQTFGINVSDWRGVIIEVAVVLSLLYVSLLAEELRR
jgi:hypothetical protein